MIEIKIDDQEAWHTFNNLKDFKEFIDVCYDFKGKMEDHFSK